jgi:hypothetical protein
VNVAPRRLAAIGLAIVLIVGVGYGIVTSIAGRLAPSDVALHGLIGSEKGPFFADQRVINALKRGGFRVTVAPAGSRQIATLDLSKEDFAFPGGAPAAEKIRRDRAGTTSIVPFFTPMAIASWKPIVDVLTKAGVVHQRNGYQALDVAAYMKLVSVDRRWKDLPGNTTYAVNKSVLVTTTDVRRSNSAAMYLSLVSYVANGDNIVENDSRLDAIVAQAAPLFLRQGFVENSSEAPFEDYLVQGMGKSPLVMIYESQFVARAAANDGSITDQMVLLYPEPTIYSKHTFVSLTENGARLGEFLANDPEMRSLATTFGFRTSDTAAFRTFVSSHQLTVADTLIDVIEPPTYETLEAMITRLEQLYAGGGASPLPSGSSLSAPSQPASSSSGPSPSGVAP